VQNTGVMKFSWCWISIRIHYSTNSKVNIHIRRMWIFFTLSHPYLSLGRFKGSGGGRPLIEWMHLKMVKILHKNASFLLKIWKNFLGRGKDLSLDPTPYFPPPPYSQVLDPLLPLLCVLLLYMITQKLFWAEFVIVFDEVLGRAVRPVWSIPELQVIGFQWKFVSWSASRVSIIFQINKF